VELTTDSIEADRVNPRPDDDVGDLRHDLVGHGASPGTPGCIAPGDVASAPRSSGAMGPGVVGLLLSGSLDSRSLPIH
jgi:hypothetical protein